MNSKVLSFIWLFGIPDCSPPGSSVHGILQPRILEWVAISSSRGSSWPRDQTQVSCIAGRFFTIWATWEIIGGARGKESSCQCRKHESRVRPLGWEDPLEEGMATHSSVLAWRTPWTEEPEKPQSIGLQRGGHDWSGLACSTRGSDSLPQYFFPTEIISILFVAYTSRCFPVFIKYIICLLFKMT